MLGLIIKDLLVCKKSLRTILLLVAVFMVFSVTTDDNTFVMFITSIYFTMMVLTAFAYDAQAKWDAYGLTMPITRSETVLAKYLLGLVLSLLGAVLSLILTFGVMIYKQEAFITGQTLLMQLAMLGAALMMMSIFIPLIYRFGVEKARLVMIAVFVLPSVLLLFFSKSGLPTPDDNVLRILATLSPFFVVGVVVMSYLISVRIFTKKEL